MLGVRSQSSLHRRGFNYLLISTGRLWGLSSIPLSPIVSTIFWFPRYQPLVPFLSFLGHVSFNYLLISTCLWRPHDNDLGLGRVVSTIFWFPLTYAFVGLGYVALPIRFNYLLISTVHGDRLRRRLFYIRRVSTIFWFPRLGIRPSATTYPTDTCFNYLLISTRILSAAPLGIYC